MVCFETIHGSLMAQINAVEKEILDRESNMSLNEAAVFLEYIVPLCRQLNSNRLELEKNNDDWRSLQELLRISRQVQLKGVLLQAKLNKIIESKQSELDEVSSKSTKKKKDTDVVSLLETLYRKQNFLKERIFSFESKTNAVCPVEAEILYNHLTQMYEWFVENQALIEKNVNSSLLNSELEIFTEVQEKVIALQTRFKKLFASIRQSTLSEENASSKHFTNGNNFELKILQKRMEDIITK